MNDREIAAVDRFRQLSAYARKNHKMRIKVVVGGRAAIGQLKIGGRGTFFYFHPFKDLCFIDGRRQPIRGCRAITEAIEKIAARMKDLPPAPSPRRTTGGAIDEKFYIRPAPYYQWGTR